MFPRQENCSHPVPAKVHVPEVIRSKSAPVLGSRGGTRSTSLGKKNGTTPTRLGKKSDLLMYLDCTGCNNLPVKSGRKLRKHGELSQVQTLTALDNKRCTRATLLGKETGTSLCSLGKKNDPLYFLTLVNTGKEHG